MSIQTSNNKQIMYLPRHLIRRPILPVLDEEKITAMRETMDKHYKNRPKVVTEKGKELLEKGLPIPVSEIDEGKSPEGGSSNDSQFEDMTPIDVLMVSDKGQRYYFGFGGCHRFQAYDRSEWDLVKVKITPTTKSQLRIYLGASVDSIFKD